MERMQKITPFQQGQSTNEHPDKPKPVVVKSRMSAVPRAGQPDPLAQSLTTPPHNRWEPMHLMKKREVEPRGHKYTPHQQWSPMKAKQESKATDPGQRTSNKGSNSLGKAMNRVGQNALGGKNRARGSGGKP